MLTILLWTALSCTSGSVLHLLLRMRALEKRTNLHSDALEIAKKKIHWIEDTVAHRILQLDKAPEDEPALVPAGEVREVVRSYQPPYKTKAWDELVSAAKRRSTGWSWEKNQRGEWLLHATAWMEKLDRAARAARLHLDHPSEETAGELERSLVAAGLERSRLIERREA